jgi:NitT/TauT family transport system substrate-binding protein
MSLGRVLATAVAGILLAACGANASQPSASTGSVSLRLGYFPNVTHATAIVGVANGAFAQALGPNVTLEAHTFNAGPEATEALFSNAIDATFIGPNPAINAFIKSHGQAVRIVSGATSGGAFLVVKDGINAAADLQGKKLATPQLGNTQDVALRSWLKDQGMTTDTNGGGDVSIAPQSNSVTLQAFQAGQLDGAWVPEPWATQMVKAGGHVLVDERSLWPDGRYVTTHLIVSTTFLQAHPDVVKNLIKGEMAATDYVNGNVSAAQSVVANEITRITGSSISTTVLATAWGNLTFTLDPIASSLQTSADAAKELGFLDTSDLKGIYDLTLLNQVLSEAGKPTIVAP